MGRCIGIRKDFKRCRNNTSKIFCKNHRFQPFVLLGGIISIIALIGGLYQDILKPSLESLEEIRPVVRCNSVLNREFQLSETDDSSFSILRFCVEVEIENVNSSPINITDVASIGWLGTEEYPELFFILKGPFYRAKYSDEDLISLPFFLHPKQKMVFYPYATFMIPQDLSVKIQEIIDANQDKEQNFILINNLLTDSKQEFIFSFVYNEIYKLYIHFFNEGYMEKLNL